MSLTTLRTFDKSIDAHLLKSKLESEGIACFLFDEHSISVNPLFSNTLGGIKLNVNSADFERAKALVEELDQRPLVDDNNELIVCPSCGSNQLYKDFNSLSGFKAVLSAIATMLLSMYPLYLKKTYKCKSCDFEFKKPVVKANDKV